MKVPKDAVTPGEIGLANGKWLLNKDTMSPRTPQPALSGILLSPLTK
jgi:hypothetical protein